MNYKLRQYAKKIPNTFDGSELKLHRGFVTLEEYIYYKPMLPESQDYNVNKIIYGVQEKRIIIIFFTDRSTDGQNYELTHSMLPSTTKDPQHIVKALLDQLGLLSPPFGNTSNSLQVTEQDASSSGKDPNELLNAYLLLAEELVRSVAISNETISMTTEHVAVRSEIVHVDSFNDTYVPIKVTEEKSYEFIKLSVGIFSQTKAIRVSTIVHRTLHETFVPKQIGNRSASIGSRVLSVSLQYVGNSGTRAANINVHDAIILILRTEIEPDRTEHSRLCTYWNVGIKSWSTDGCRQVVKNQSHTTCSCNHLTNFAVLVLYAKENQAGTDYSVNSGLQHINSVSRHHACHICLSEVSRLSNNAISKTMARFRM
ncbi:hypothetical protein CHS0354_004562, partial [Potamilus streckersoni]